MTDFLLFLAIPLALGIALLICQYVPPLLFDWRETPYGLEFVILRRWVIRRVVYSDIIRVDRVRFPRDLAQDLVTITWKNRFFAKPVFVETRSGQRFQFTPPRADEFVHRIRARSDAGS